MNKEEVIEMKPADGLQPTMNDQKERDSDYAVGGTENPNCHQVGEGKQPNCLTPATEDQNSLGGETGMMIKNNEADPTTNDHYLEHQNAIFNNGAPILGTQGVSPKENKKAEVLTEEDKAKLKVKLEFASSEFLLGFSELLSIKFLPENSVSVQTLTAIAILSSLALLSGFCLLMHTLFILAPRSNFTAIHRTISKVLVIMSCTTLVLASLPLLLLPKPYNFLIPIVLTVVLLTLGAHLYLRYKTSNAKSEKEQTEYNKQMMKEITRLSELSQVVMSLSSGGLIGVLFGIHKNASNHAHNPAVSATVFLTFTSFIFSTFFMFLCQMRLVHLNSGTREKFLKIGEVFCQFLLVLLAFAALVVTYKFLKVYTIIISIPVLIVFVIWQYSNNIFTRETKDTAQEEELKLAYTKANKVTSISYAGIMAIFSGYLGSAEKNMHLNICMIFMASAFLLGLCLMLLSYKPSTRPHNGTVVHILSCSAVILLAFGGLAIFILEFM